MEKQLRCEGFWVSLGFVRMSTDATTTTTAMTDTSLQSKLGERFGLAEVLHLELVGEVDARNIGTCLPKHSTGGVLSFINLGVLIDLAACLSTVK